MTDAESFYDSLQVSVNRRYARGWRAQLSYTLSESTDDASGINSQDFSNNVQYVSDWYDLEHDRGLSAFHARHNLTANASWELPFAANSTGVTGALLRWMAAERDRHLAIGSSVHRRARVQSLGEPEHHGILTARTARSEARVLRNPVLGGWERYWDVSCFQLPAVNTRGNLGRNTVIGPGLVSIDASLVKSFQLGGTRTLQVRSKRSTCQTARTSRCHPDASPSPVSVPTARRCSAPTWGRITSTVTTSRQIQVGAKLSF